MELLKKNDLSVGGIAKHFDMTGATLSHHLNKLKRADLVVAKRKGQTIIYSINTSVFEDMSGFLMDLFSTKGVKNGSVHKK